MLFQRTNLMHKECSAWFISILNPWCKWPWERERTKKNAYNTFLSSPQWVYRTQHYMRDQVSGMNIWKIYSCLLLIYNGVLPKSITWNKYMERYWLFISNFALTRECFRRDLKDIAFTCRAQFRWINIHCSKMHKFAVMLTWDHVLFIIDATCIQIRVKPHHLLDHQSYWLIPWNVWQTKKSSVENQHAIRVGR